MKVGLLVAVLLVLAAAQPVGAPDVPGRAQAWVALQSSVVLVSYGGSPPRIGHAYCGGTIVAPMLVLTASHCVWFADRTYYVLAYTDRQKAVEAKRVWIRPEADLALLRTNEPLAGRVAQPASDIAVGEEISLVGAPNSGSVSVPFMLTRGTIGIILTMNFHIDPTECPGSEAEPFGQADHQVILSDVHAYFGNSGGGAFNASGQLVGVLVRGESATIEGRECAEYNGEHILWSYIVGLDELRKVPRP